MRIALAGPMPARLARALEGLVARGHVVVAGTAAQPCDVVLGERPLAAAWRAVQGHARAIVLQLDADAHARWSPLDHWAFAMSGAWGLVSEHEVPVFLARVAEHDHERLALWATGSGDGSPALRPDTQLLERACERAIARRVAGPSRSALFVDRDGTLILERHHLSDPEGVELLPGVAEALRVVRAAGHPVVVVSNQAGVGRGWFDESRVHAVMARMRQLLRAEGVELDAVRFCPHAPEAACDCRKPGTRMLREAADDLRLSLVASVVVGDKWIDVDAGHAARAAGVLVRTGHGREEEGAPRAESARPADLVCDDLPAAVRWFLAQQD